MYCGPEKHAALPTSANFKNPSSNPLQKSLLRHSKSCLICGVSANEYSCTQKPKKILEILPHIFNLWTSVSKTALLPAKPLVCAPATSASSNNLQNKSRKHFHPQSNEITRGPAELVQHFGARALHVLNLMWFGTRL